MLPAPTRTAKFDLFFNFVDVPSVPGQPQPLPGFIEYASDLFDHATVEKFATYYLRILAAVSADPGRRIDRIEIIDPAEREQVLLEWNDTATAVPEETLPELLAAQIARTPQAPAVEDGHQTLTYRELDTRADRLARRLKSYGARPETVIAVALPRSVDLVIALVAITKTGAAYLPIDPNYPSGRTAYILTDAAPQLVITNTVIAQSLPDTNTPLLILDTIDLHGSGMDTPEPELDDLWSGPDNLAYIMYTSGSTGNPKAVAISHRNVVALFAGVEWWCGFSDRDVWAWCHSPAFDVSVWELWGALLHGARVVVVSWDTVRSPRELWQLVLHQRVTVLSQTPSAFYELMGAERECPASAQDCALRMVVFGGEALDTSRLWDWYPERRPQAPMLINMYGTTETTVHATHRELTSRDAAHGASPDWCSVGQCAGVCVGCGVVCGAGGGGR